MFQAEKVLFVYHAPEIALDLRRIWTSSLVVTLKPQSSDFQPERFIFTRAEDLRMWRV